MIRFCDREVNCILLNEIDRSQLLTYFLNGHRADVVCVFDEDGKFYGTIEYRSFLATQNPYDAVCRDFITIGNDMWQGARKCFLSYRNKKVSVPLLPVMDCDGNLMCFAYEDERANRQIRMIREITENDNMLQFTDIYPEYDCVTIYECNELAWHFAKYLQNIGVPVRVEGSLWKYFGERETFECLEYRNYTIYAEGTWQKNSNLEEYLLRSVSVCFECVDKIYEANIHAGNILNSDGEFNTVLQKIKDKDVFILGTGMKSQDVYDILLGNGIEAKGFIHYKQKFLLNKPVFEINDATDNFENPVFIQADEKSSAWGFGEVDMYDYYGFHRNESFFLIEDYMKVETTMLQNTLKGKDVVLAGEVELCECVHEYLEQHQPEIGNIYYWDVLQEENDTFMKCVSGENTENSILLQVGWHYSISFVGKTNTYKVDKYSTKIDNEKNRTDYFLDYHALIRVGSLCGGYTTEALLPAGIIIGSINGHSGNILLRDIFDNHQELIVMPYGFLNKELFYFCMFLSRKRGRDIPEFFWKLYDEASLDRWEISLEEREKFNEELIKELKIADKFTSQELFVIFQVVYAKMKRGNLIDTNRLYIYWEAHSGPEKHQDYAEWLSDERIKGNIIRMVRNKYGRIGSRINHLKKKYNINENKRDIACTVTESSFIKYREYAGYKNILITFENLKCNPKETLYTLCKEIGIMWDDTLLETTQNGKKHFYYEVTGFDLKPVYNIYEEFLSEFDRMRVSLVGSSFQKRYGYPYVEYNEFSRMEIQEMFLKDFRYEQEMEYINSEEKIIIKKAILDNVDYNLQKQRCGEYGYAEMYY